MVSQRAQRQLKISDGWVVYEIRVQPRVFFTLKASLNLTSVPFCPGNAEWMEERCWFGTVSFVPAGLADHVIKS